MAVTPATVLTRVRDLLAESETDYYTDAELYRYMSDGQEIIADRVPCVYSTNSQDTTSNVREYTIPSNIVAIQRVSYDKEKLKCITLNELDVLEDQRSDSSVMGTPEYYYLQGNTLGLSPVPDSAEALKVYYHAEPSEVDATTSFSVPSWMGRKTEDYVLYRAFGKDDLLEKASMHKAEWEKSLSEIEFQWYTRNHGDQYTIVKDEELYPSNDLGLR